MCELRVLEWRCGIPSSADAEGFSSPSEPSSLRLQIWLIVGLVTCALCSSPAAREMFIWVQLKVHLRQQAETAPQQARVSLSGLGGGPKECAHPQGHASTSCAAGRDQLQLLLCPELGDSRCRGVPRQPCQQQWPPQSAPAWLICKEPSLPYTHICSCSSPMPAPLPSCSCCSLRCPSAPAPCTTPAPLAPAPSSSRSLPLVGCCCCCC